MRSATPTIVATAGTAAGTRRRRSSRIVGIRSAGRGRGGETRAMGPATIAVVPACITGQVTICKRFVRNFPWPGAASTVARVAAAPCPPRCTRSRSPLPSRAWCCWLRRVPPRFPSSRATPAPARGGVLWAGAGARSFALAPRARRSRALAMLAAPVLAVLAIGTLATRVHVPSVGPAIVGAAALAGLAVLALTWLVLRRPNTLPLLAVAALPFRVPVSVGSTTANLLLPLYGVIAAGILAYAWRWLRSHERTEDTERERLLRWLQLAFAGVLVLYAAQSLYSSDNEQA